MSVLWVTGAKGFIGSHLVSHLAGQGAHVGGIGGAASASGDALTGGLAHWVGGAVGPETLDLLESRTGTPATIFHLAGGSSIGASLADPAADFERTVGSSAALLEWMRWRAPEAALVAVSSAAVYGTGHDRPIPEDAPARPCSPYGCHKQAMESLCRSYAENFGLRVAVARLFSVYGPGLRKQLLWDLCGHLAASGGARLGGTGRELRDWTHVGDVVRFLEILGAHASTDVPIVNGATGIGTSVRDVARHVGECYGVGDDAIAFSGETRPGDPFSLVGAVDARLPFAFEPSVTLDQGIGDYVDWFKRQARGL